MNPRSVCRWCQQPLMSRDGITACPHCDSTACRNRRPCATCALAAMPGIPDPDFTNRAEGS